MSGTDRLRWSLVAAIPVLGVLQAWDSDVFKAPAAVIALVLTGIGLLTVAPVLVPKPQLSIAALLSGIIAIVAARMISPISHNELFITFLVGVLFTMMLLARQGTTAEDGAKAQETR